MHRSDVQNNATPSTSAQYQFPAFFQNRLLLTPVEAGAFCGWARQTVYNKISAEEFPIPTIELDGKKMVRTVDLLEYVKNLPAATSHTQVAKRVGRPTKEESIRRELEKSGGLK